MLVAATAHQQHGDDGAHVRQAGQHADVQWVRYPGIADQGRQPEGNRVLAHDYTEVDAGQQP
ncbi:hypothetical protein D3C75_1198020 [compost metagenome]